MKSLPVFFLNLIFIPYLVFLCLISLVAAPVYYALGFLALRGQRFEDLVRRWNWCFGQILCRATWPVIRVRCTGRENMPDEQACIAVANHRSFLDVALCTYLPRSNLRVVVRDWPFHLPLFGFFMRRARYVNVEKENLDRTIEEARKDRGSGVSYLFFPEGHRSRDGNMRPFRSGAFLLAQAIETPIVPICILGSEHLGVGARWVRPCCIHIHILPPLYPRDFPGEKGALRLRREAYRIIEEYLEREEKK